MVPRRRATSRNGRQHPVVVSDAVAPTVLFDLQDPDFDSGTTTQGVAMPATTTYQPSWAHLEPDQIAVYDDLYVNLRREAGESASADELAIALIDALPHTYLDLRTAARRVLLAQDEFWVPRQGWGEFEAVVFTEGCRHESLDRHASNATGARQLVDVDDMAVTWQQNCVNMLRRSSATFVIGAYCSAHLERDDEEYDYLGDVLHGGETTTRAWLNAKPLMRRFETNITDAGM